MRKQKMSTVFIEEKIRVPDWVSDLTSFRQWAHSPEFPERGRISYLKDEVWVDMSKEQFYHNQLKGEIASILTAFVKKNRLGIFFPDGMLLSDLETNFATGPDGIFVSKESLRTGRLTMVEGAKGGYVELQGAPDMVLEVISPSSVGKDTVVLREVYWDLGVDEYWLVDGRGEKLDFDILRHGPKEYLPVRKPGGWLRSTVFGASFRLTRKTDEMGHPEFTLGVR
jgi:Uma2 family endonuclease